MGPIRNVLCLSWLRPERSKNAAIENIIFDAREERFTKGKAVRSCMGDVFTLIQKPFLTFFVPMDTTQTIRKRGWQPRVESEGANDFSLVTPGQRVNYRTNDNGAGKKRTPE